MVCKGITWLKALERNILLSKINHDLFVVQKKERNESCKERYESLCNSVAGLHSAMSSDLRLLPSVRQPLFLLIHEHKMVPTAPNITSTFEGRKQRIG